jgi:predicted ATP-binding protein involved in virulence
MEAYEIGTFEVGVRLKRLALKRFRGFEEELEVSFDRDLTVFIGVNGAGKSTILDAAAGLLDELACIIQNEPYKPERYFGFFDVNNEQGVDGTAELGLTFALDFPKRKPVVEDGVVVGEAWELIKDYDYAIELELKRGKNLSAEVDIRYDEAKIGEDTVRNALREDLNAWMKLSSDPSFAHHTSIALPVLAYFPVRVIEEADTNGDDDRPVDTDLFVNYRNHELSGKSFSFGVLKKWLALQYLMKTQERKRAHEQPRDRKLFDTILGAIKQFVNDEGNEEAYTDIYFEWTPDFPNGEMVLDKKGGSVYYRQLSSGEKAVIALVADLARQLALVNPKADNPLGGLGVVLIDEIDLHLHPSWQRRLVPKLREVFPNVQFVVTTHSPMVLSSVNSSQGRIVKNGMIENVGYVKGRDATSILEDEFGERGRSGDLMKQLDEFYDLLNKNREKAESKLEDLKKVWGENDTEIIRAESYLDIF